LSEPRLAARWRELRGRRRVALIPYVTAGYPDARGSREALAMVVDAGADFVELGIPFSDPLADGPVIQRASHTALEGGMSVRGALALLHDARLPVPVVVFSYLNPLLAYGLERFAADAVSAGADAVLVTDLPAGEDPATEDTLRAAGLSVIRLLAPTTTARRLEPVVRGAEGFLYLIARLGVTGARTQVGHDLASTIARVRAATTLPIAVGFGIAGGEEAAAVARMADGVVVGSALVERLGRGLGAARSLMRELRGALDHVVP
jgi:tryptophan synthase alpha chain